MKKKSEDETEVVEDVDFRAQVMSLIKKDFGSDIAVDARDFLEKKYRVIPVCPSIDAIIGGGIPEGSWVTLAGKPKCGKSVTALHFATQCQKQENGGKHVYYLNVEGRLKKMNLESTKGLNPDKFTVIESSEDKILSAADYLNIGEKILLGHRECLLIIDSYAALCPEKEINEGVGTSTRGGGAMLLSQFCRQMCAVVPIKKSIVLGINQLMANTSGFGASVVEKGGMGVAYQVDVKLKCKKDEAWADGDDIIGKQIHWYCECSALGAPPGQETISHFRYNYGIDELKELIIIATDAGLIEKSGAWFVCSFMKNHEKEWDAETIKKYRAQGEHKLYKLITENPEILEHLKQDIKALL